MGKARGSSRSIQLLVVITFLAVSSCFATGQAASDCSGPKAEISRLTRPTGVLRADPNANETAAQKIAADVQRVCAALSDPSAFRQVRMTMSDNAIVLSGMVPTQSDEQQLIAIAIANADGRTVFNRLEVVPLQMASRRRQ